jgi:trigger factor
MKTEFIDVSDTKKDLVVEIPSTVVDSEIDRVARDYSKAARIPGFRPGKVPAKLVRQRFRDQILHDVAHDLIPRAVDEALRERGVEPVDTPNIRDVVVEEGQPLKFTASFETVPPIQDIDYATILLRRRTPQVEPDAVPQTLTRLRERAAHYEPVEDRPAEHGDTVLLDLQRRAAEASGGRDGEESAPGGTAGAAEAESHENISVEIGASANPPGFDEALMGIGPGEVREFTLSYPDDYAIRELAGTHVHYRVTAKAVRRRVLPELDDEFAKSVGPFESLDALRVRVEEDLLREAKLASEREVRAELLKLLAQKVAFEVPSALLEREIDRRVEDFVKRLIEQQIDPRRTEINWDEFRDRQREPALEAVRGALVLDEVARRENLQVTADEVDREVARYAERSGRTVAAVRARLEKESGITRLYTGLRREKAVDFLLSRAKIVDA